MPIVYRIVSEVCVLSEFSNTYICNSKVNNEGLKIREQHLLSLAVLDIYIPYNFVQMI